MQRLAGRCCLRIMWKMDLLNRTRIHSSPCSAPIPSSFQNETSEPYETQISIGDGLYVFGFIGILILLKSLLTMINMVEDTPKDNGYTLPKHETFTSTKVHYQSKDTVLDQKGSIMVTPPNSPHLCHTRNFFVPSLTFFNGNRYFLPSNLAEDQENERRCPFSSPVGSTKSLV
ncbi:hypothetical protein XENTR_v10004872 [Xenopus tropicalis]|nr:hypothetical protein XENTR_v10004872 [Xenopus tropicalis]KAE8621550.1 hypothetical protein XENTR_v10004872 [Xenopus tropicalis]KAE8621551.1 hypothetical protein XENTR_v10004872 [Xenopus tropicalis]